MTGAVFATFSEHGFNLKKEDIATGLRLRTWSLPEFKKKKIFKGQERSYLYRDVKQAAVSGPLRQAEGDIQTRLVDLEKSQVDQLQ